MSRFINFILNFKNYEQYLINFVIFKKNSSLPKVYIVDIQGMSCAYASRLLKKNNQIDNIILFNY